MLGQTAVIIAVRTGPARQAQDALRFAGADLAATDVRGWTVLDHARARTDPSRTQVIEYLQANVPAESEGCEARRRRLNRSSPIPTDHDRPLAVSDGGRALPFRPAGDRLAPVAYHAVFHPERLPRPRAGASLAFGSRHDDHHCRSGPRMTACSRLLRRGGGARAPSTWTARMGSGDHDADRGGRASGEADLASGSGSRTSG